MWFPLGQGRLLIRWKGGPSISRCLELDWRLIWTDVKGGGEYLAATSPTSFPNTGETWIGNWGRGAQDKRGRADVKLTT